MSLRDTLRKAAGLIVELPPEEPPELPDEPAGSPVRERAMSEVEKVYEQYRVDKPGNVKPAGVKTVEQIVREAEGPNLDQIRVQPAPAALSAPSAPVLNPDGVMNFGAVYSMANLPPSPFSAEQVLELLSSLPAELPLETKRQTVKVSISAMGKAIGATPENIVADASRKLAALTTYSEHLAKQTAQVVTAAEAEIANLEGRIAQMRQSIASAQQKQAQIAQSCEAESDRLDDVLEFFSLDVPPSRYAAPPTNTP